MPTVGHSFSTDARSIFARQIHASLQIDSGQYCVCKIGCASVRSAAGGRGAAVNQLLFGETAEVVDRRGSWNKIRNSWDNSGGWVKSNQLLSITVDEFLSYRKNSAITLNLLQPVFGTHHAVPVPIGSLLPTYDGIRFSLGNENYRFSGQALLPTETQPTVELLLRILHRYRYAPELAGGRTPLGIDSGALAQNIFRMFATRLYRQPQTQIRQGKVVSFVQESQPGDLAFFDTGKGGVDVGIVVPDRRVVYIDGYVRTGTLDHEGVFDEVEENYTRKLRVIRRLLDFAPIPEEIRIETTVAPSQARLF